MPNNYFTFKKFTIVQEKSVFKVGTDGVLLGACADLSGARKILDVGTGTGLIALMAAQRSDANIVAIEPDLNSCNEARSNVINSEWTKRITVLNTGFRNYSSDHPESFDVILSNPPYFRDSLLNPDENKSSARHSYSLGPEEILQGAIKLLNPDGSLQVILPYTEGTLFIAEASSYGFYCNRIIKVRSVPMGNIKRLILKLEKIRKQVHEKFLTVGTGTRHQFTKEYKEITRDFYLKF